MVKGSTLQNFYKREDKITVMGENEIDKLFKRQLSSLEVPPPERVWAGIEGGLKASPRMRGLVLLLRWGAVAAVMLLFVFFLQRPGKDSSTIQPLARQSGSESAHSPKPFLGENSSAGFTPIVQDSASQPDDLHERAGIRLKVLRETAQASVGGTFVSNIQGETRSSTTNEMVEIPQREADRLAPAMNRLISRGGDSMANVAVPVAELAQHYHQEHPSLALKTQEEYNAREPALAKGFRLRVRVGGEYSPTYAFRQVSGGSQVGSAAYSEGGLMTSSGGLKVSVQMHRRWSVETGVRYAMLGQEVKASFNEVRLYSSMAAANEESLSLRNINLGNSMGAIRTPDVAKSPAFSDANMGAVKSEVVDFQIVSQPDVRTDIEQLLGYVEIPLTLRYEVFERGLSVSVSGGLSTNWLVGNDAYLYDSGTKRNLGKTEGLANMSFSTHAGLAVSLPLHQSFTLQLEPRVSYFLSDISEDYPTSFKPYSFGVFTGIFYSFGK